MLKNKRQILVEIKNLLKMLKEQEENRKDLLMVSAIVGFLVIGIGVIGIILMVTVK